MAVNINKDTVYRAAKLKEKDYKLNAIYTKFGTPSSASLNQSLKM